jgi:integrase
MPPILPPTAKRQLTPRATSFGTVQALAAHTDLKVIQHMLGHSSIVTTADTYTSVLPEVAHDAAQASADLIMRVARSVPRSRRPEPRLTHETVAVDDGGYRQA